MTTWAVNSYFESVEEVDLFPLGGRPQAGPPEPLKNNDFEKASVRPEI